MRSFTVFAGVALALLALGTTAVAQSPAPDVSALAERCQEGADDDMQLATCLWVVSTVLDPAASPSPEYGADLPGPGVTLSRDDETVTLVDVDWNAKGTRGRPDGKANRYVAIRVLYQATADGASYNGFNWSVVDLDGFAWDQAYGVKEPDLQSSSDLPDGRKAQGWVTFEVPRDVHRLEVVESQDGYLRWMINEK